MKRSKGEHKETHSGAEAEVRRLEGQLRELRSTLEPFDYAARTRIFELTQELFHAIVRAYRTYHADAEDHARIEAARERFHRAWDAVYPPGFWDDYERLRSGDTAGMESAARFLEADPVFYRSGYVKQKLIRAIKPHMIDPHYAARLQNVVLHMVDTRDDRDFRNYCRLARKVDTPELRAQLARRMTEQHGDVRHRARWVLETLAQKDTQKEEKDAAGNVEVIL